jgi:myo-inositol catabolism protein IolS
MSGLPSPFGLGTFQFRAATADSDAARVAAEVWRAAYAHGVRHVDTAQSYGDGVSEQAVASFLDGYKDIFVATKIHYAPSAAEAMRAVEASRRRLRRDVIDLVYLHWPRRGRDVRPVMEGLERCRASGTIRHVGASNFSVEELRTARDVCGLDFFQVCYSLLWRYPERDVIPYCRENGIAVVSYSALAQGLLAGRIRDRGELAAGDPRLKTVYYDPGVFEAVQAAVARMTRVASEAGQPLARLSLEWVLTQPGVSATLVGASSAAQVADTLRADFAGGAPRVRASIQRLGAISDEVRPSIPDIGNIFKHYP